jgi:glutathione S-transferase
MSNFFALFAITNILLLKLSNSLRISMKADTLYNMPISNYGARVRMIISAKKIVDKVEILSPTEIGGLKSPEYLSLNLQGKMPLLVCGDGMAIPESDTICRYLLDKYPQGPSFLPGDLKQRVLSEQICRLHDIYLGPVLGTMYKAPGTPFSIYGLDRSAGLAELKKQLLCIENVVAKFDSMYPSLTNNFLCGSEISLADAALYPSMVFCMFILPQIFGWEEKDVLGPRLMKWWNFMSNEVEEARIVRNDIENGLSGWKTNGRWNPILEEMKSIKA